ncbi:hypothetical protein [Anaeromicropila populeti]|uniref:J domain-containing protein n=1 Tax=Anaeromicropila populeti TaxID=37658 RepID=A0A1I6IE55_9FIRM|nr:hypothetical protein [Anaeromicropila populeti]SFR64976.1 hypothetical protein SAMN05661086_00751 [Anaeromicropila populeti]
MYSIDEILNMKEPYELFEGNLIQAKEKRNQLLKLFHPDISSKDMRRKEVVVVIQELYEKAVKQLMEGSWSAPGYIRWKGKEGKVHEMNYKRKYSFELGEMFFGNNVVLYALEEEQTEFAQNYLCARRKIQFVNDEMKTEFDKYLPNIITNFTSQNNKHCIVVRKQSDLYCLKEILWYYGGCLNAESIAWILSSLYNIICLLAYNNMTHNGIAIENYFISPEKHYGALLGGWWYGREEKQRMLGVSEEIYKIMPYAMQGNKLSNIQLDLESVRRIGRQLAGDETGISLVDKTGIPEPMVRWLRGTAGENPWEEYEEWEQVLTTSFGARRFVSMEFTPLEFERKAGGMENGIWKMDK